MVTDTGGDAVRLIGQVIQQRYRLERVLGEGGMGAVYQAEHMALGRKVAVKLLRAQYGRDEEYESRFSAEARQAARVTDPRVVTIYDFGRTEDGRLFLVMELVRGRTLRELIPRSGVPVARARQLAADLAGALRAVHAAGILHRDVKPENVVVVDGQEGVKLLDFGIARPTQRAAGDRATQAGFVVGTAGYVSPEQIKGEPLSCASDVYGWAVVLFEMLTGNLPYEAPTDTMMLVKQATERPRDLRKLRPDVPEDLERLLGACLERDPDKRPREMGEVLRRLGATATAPGRPPPATRVVERPSEASAPGTPRSPRWPALAVVLVIAGALILASALWMGRQPRTGAAVNQAPALQPRAAELPAAIPGDMVLVPAGPFFMGCNEAVDRECDDNEKPGRTVSVAAFRIDRTEVTVAAYRRCVEGGGCSADGVTVPVWAEAHPDEARACNWGKAGREQHPMNCVDWKQARAYCAWAGKRLPTEAEWEKAARGTEGRKYPWGNIGYEPASRVANIADETVKRAFPDAIIASGYDDGFLETASVGSFPAGASPCGALDMAGNVWEWTADLVNPEKEPGAVVRGGSFHFEPRHARASHRSRLPPRTRLENIGLRCAQ